MGVSIFIEGSEGAGKTLLNAISGTLIRDTTDLPVSITREPGGTILAEELRSFTRDMRFHDSHGIVNTLLYTTARADVFFRKDLPFLENRNAVLLKDRSWLTTLCLQTVDGADKEYIESVQSPFMKLPDKFVIIDIPVEETLVRIEAERRISSGARDIDWRDSQTQENFHTIRENYLAFAQQNKDRCVVLSCFNQPWENAAKIKELALKLLGMGNKEAGHNYVEQAESICRSHPDFTHLSNDLNHFVKQTEIVRNEREYPTVEEMKIDMESEWLNVDLRRVID
jgi:dTMP kinase